MNIHGSHSVAATGARVALKAFGQELRTARVEAGVRQEDAAEELGVSTQTIRNWESAGRNRARRTSKSWPGSTAWRWGISRFSTKNFTPIE